MTPIKLIMIFTLLATVADSAFSETLGSSSSMSPVTQPIHEKSIIQPFLDSLCGELFANDRYLKISPEKLKIRKFNQPCRMLRSFDEVDRLLESETSNCKEICQANRNTCEAQICAEGCDAEKRAGSLAKKSFGMGLDAELKKLDSSRLDSYLDWLCNDLYRSEYFSKKSFLPKSPPTKQAKVPATETSESNFRAICKRSRSTAELKASIDAELKICEANCAALENGRNSSAGKTGSQGDLAKLSACASDVCKARCAGEKNAGFLAGELFEKGLSASH